MARSPGPYVAFTVCLVVYLGVSLLLGSAVSAQLFVQGLVVAAVVAVAMALLNRRISARKSSESPDRRPTASNPPTAD